MVGLGAGTGPMASLLVKLSDLLVGEYKLLKGVRKEVEFLKRELGRMHALLQSLADMEKLDPMAKDWRGNVRDLSYDLEDCVDRFIDRLGKGDAKRGYMKKMARLLRTLSARHDIGTQIKDLKARVIEESQRRDRYKIDESCKPAASAVEIDPRLAAFYEGAAKGLVAIDGPMEQVISWLMDEKMELKVVSIVGSAGLGKTTLANEVYRKIGEQFQCRASISVSRNLDLDKLLKDILSQIDKEKYKICQSQGWEKEQLIREIIQIFTGKRYFIFVDDVWREQDWKILKVVFPENDNGSRIIATTRITSVANSCCSSLGAHPYQMEPLKDVDSRRLFFKRIFHSDNSCPPQLENVSARILRKCGGLPLAIITMASLLANKPQNEYAWESVQGSIGIDSSLGSDGNLKVMNDILLLSYWDLPHYLKTCLLYLCIYPEDHRIECKQLKYKWIGEGFIDTQWGNQDREAENYLNELVNRNMIQPGDIFSDGSIEYCWVHDMVLDLMISLSDEENFSIVLNGRVCNSLPSKIRRLSVQYSGQDHKRAVHAITQSKLCVRSLNLFCGIGQMPTLVDFYALRVLDLAGQTELENKHIRNIGSFSQLRYLRLGGRITALPQGIGELRNLETLDLSHCRSINRGLPSTIVQLRKLVRLLIHPNIMLPVAKFRSMQALEEVSCVAGCDVPLHFAIELGFLENLRKLTINCRPMLPFANDRELFLEILRLALTHLGKCNIASLGICGTIGSPLFRDPGCIFPHLQDLHIYKFVPEVPKGMASLEHVAKLDITVSKFGEECLHILAGMPSLAHLKLSVCGLADVDKKLTVGSDGFKLLKVFHYEIDLGYETVIPFAEGSMPALRRLLLRFHAKELMSGYRGGADLGLKHLSGLAHLRIETVCSFATRSEVEAVESSVQKGMALHPNRQTIQVDFSRTGADEMFADVNDRDNRGGLLWMFEIVRKAERYM